MTAAPPLGDMCAELCRKAALLETALEGLMRIHDQGSVVNNDRHIEPVWYLAGEVTTLAELVEGVVDAEHEAKNAPVTT